MPGLTGIDELTDHDRMWYTPHGELVARVVQRYYGLHSQVRVALRDKVGRVHHYDVTEVETQEMRSRGQVVHTA